MPQVAGFDFKVRGVGGEIYVTTSGGKRGGKKSIMKNEAKHVIIIIHCVQHTVIFYPRQYKISYSLIILLEQLGKPFLPLLLILLLASVILVVVPPPSPSIAFACLGFCRARFLSQPQNFE